MSNEPGEQEKVRELVNIDQLIHSPTRLSVLAHLYVVESADYIFLKNMTGATWGSLSTHLTKLEDGGYIVMEKSFRGKKPHTMICLSDKGREAFRAYKSKLQSILDDLPE